MRLSKANHAFITGGASGIGLGIADALAERGLAVTIVDVDAATLASVVASRGDRFAGYPLDVRDRDGWARVKAEAEGRFGPVDVLANNAGIGPDGAGYVEITAEAFDRIIGINLVGVFNGIHAFASDMKARGRGHIVNTSSVAGLFASAPGTSAYGAAKFGVTAMSEALQVELAAHGVGVSVVCPGFVATNIVANTGRISGEDITYDAGGFPPDAMTPAAAGEIVARGIEANDLYILTHPEMWPMVEGRHEAIRAAFAAGGVR